MTAQRHFDGGPTGQQPGRRVQPQCLAEQPPDELESLQVLVGHGAVAEDFVDLNVRAVLEVGADRHGVERPGHRGRRGLRARGAPAVDVRTDPGRVDDVADLVGEPPKPGRRVLHGEQLRREAVEVVDRARSRHRGDRGRVDVPVRAHHEDRAPNRAGMTGHVPDEAARVTISD